VAAAVYTYPDLCKFTMTHRDNIGINMYSQ
jgi:hypothetical protein